MDGQFWCRESGTMPRPRAHSRCSTLPTILLPPLLLISPHLPSDTRRTGRSMSRGWSEGHGSAFRGERGEPSQLTEGRLRSREEQMQQERQQRLQPPRNGSLQNGAVASPPRNTGAAATTAAAAHSSPRPVLETQTSAPAGVTTSAALTATSSRAPVARSSSVPDRGQGARDHSEAVMIEGAQGLGPTTNGMMPSNKSKSTSQLSAGEQTNGAAAARRPSTTAGAGAGARRRSSEAG